MLKETWNLFYQTGNIETYLLLKELEQQADLNPEQDQKNQAESTASKGIDLPSF